MTPNDIVIINNFISDHDIKFFIDYIDKNCKNENLFRKRIGVAYGKGVAYRAIFPDEKPATLYKEIENKISFYSDLFLKEIKKITNTKNYFYGVSITKLSEDIHFRIHKDVHNTLTSLKYSGVLYLNDNYNGGEISFLEEFNPTSNFPLYDKSMGGFCYKPTSKDMVIFPSNKWHGGTKVSDGDRYSIIFWSTEDEKYQFKGFDSDVVWDRVEEKILNDYSR